MFYLKQCKLLIIFCLLAFSLSGCGGGSSKQVKDAPIPERKPPVVNAGEDQVITEESTVTLSAVATDSDGEIVTYLWTQISGDNVQLNRNDLAEVTFLAPDLASAQTLIFKVEVTDNDGLIHSDEVAIEVQPFSQPKPIAPPQTKYAPIVNAGEDQTVKETATVTLVAVATDSDGSIEAYQWAQTSGPSVQINNDDKAEATFIAPDIGNSETLEFEIVVTDNDGLTASDKLVITVNFIPTFTNVNVITGDEQITLSWELNNNNKIDQIRYFNVENNITKEGHINVNIIDDISQNEYSISDLNNGLPYYFQLDTSVSGSVVRHVTEGIPKSSSTGLLNDTGLFYDSAYLKALIEKVPDNLRPKPCSDKDGVGQQDCSHGRNAQLLAGNLLRSGYNPDNGFDFNVLDATGNFRVDSQPWTCVRDNHTGLVWEVKTDDGGIHDKDNKYRWGGKTARGNGLGTYYPDWDVLVNGSNADYFCGYNDWRVPTLKELHSVIDYSKNFPTFDKAFFTNTIDSGIYWTSSPFAESDEDAWYIFLGEPLGNKAKRENNNYVRLVRGGGH